MVIDLNSHIVEISVPICLLEASGMRKLGSAITPASTAVPTNIGGTRYSIARQEWVPRLDSDDNETHDSASEIRMAFMPPFH